MDTASSDLATGANAVRLAKHRASPEEMRPHDFHRHIHPTYVTMIKAAITDLGTGKNKAVSKAAILKYLASHFELGEHVPKINSHLRLALKKGVEDGDFCQVKGRGALGSFALPGHPDAIKKPEPKKEEKKKVKTTKKMGMKKKPTKKSKEGKLNKKSAKRIKKTPRAKKTPAKK